MGACRLFSHACGKQVCQGPSFSSHVARCQAEFAVYNLWCDTRAVFQDLVAANVPTAATHQDNVVFRTLCRTQNCNHFSNKMLSFLCDQPLDASCAAFSCIFGSSVVVASRKVKSEHSSRQLPVEILDQPTAVRNPVQSLARRLARAQAHPRYPNVAA